MYVSDCGNEHMIWFDVVGRRVAGELYVNQAKVSLVLPVTTTEGKKQFLYLLGKSIECSSTS